MPQPKRTETLDRFRNGEIRLLVASDVAARGLDIKGMSHVFCFDVPIHAEDYVHRIGRTGRAGLEGRSFMLASPEDGDAVAAIVKLIGREIPPSPSRVSRQPNSNTASVARAAGHDGPSSPIVAAPEPMPPHGGRWPNGSRPNLAPHGESAGRA